ncbi:paralemmin-1-like isoform X2 [Sinocyclocheilus rhinocerous]|uniref:paralemmin-1-like isoform X1 n=1 Tax=Sinocyclocheilus rhinocerous TaxID=307959 RepID=UPI0007B7BCB4|nr:PREDICTED: paralemmin-1-like isoform X1 [Sinocyclocheilus rhinocerous]XP_016388064.1 PREDICTED: paralemmin-1-like isoform X2 [Sinocyclocheilus rhinocerous]
MEMSESVSQQERLQAIAEKRKRQIEIENKKRQLEDDRRQLQHLKSKALRERWLLDGAPSAGPDEDETTKQLREDEAKTRGLEETILRLERELEELETAVSATSTKEDLSDAVQEINTKTVEKTVVTDSVKEVKVHVSPRLEKSGGVSDMMRAAMYSVEITVEKDLVTGKTKVLSTNTLLPKDLSQQGVKVYEDEQKVVHEVRSVDGAVTNGVHQLSSSEVDELLHKADEVTMSESSSKTTPQLERGQAEKVEKVEKDVVPATAPIKEITGVEAKPAAPQTEVGGASAENPVTMVFMGYQSVEDEDETKKVLGLESTTVKAEVVLIEDGDAKTATSDSKQEQAPPNGSSAEPPKAEEAAGESGQPEGGAAEVKSKEKQPCKCCTIM